MTLVGAIDEARSFLRNGTLVEHWAGGKLYEGYLLMEGSDGEFYFEGTEKGGTETIGVWDRPSKFLPIE